MSKNKHNNVAIFIPHNGCKNQCSFCNQVTITGQSKQPTIKEVKNILDKAYNNLSSKGMTAEIAYFGGSFTAIDKSYMLDLLSVAASFLGKGTFSGIRLSTRPDAIDKDILNILKQSGVTAIELGCQSMNDKVLLLNKRGHTVKDILKASYMIKNEGFSLGHQMMTGLYGSNEEIDFLTARHISEVKPDTVRIYPTIVMRGTLLESLYVSGKYNPPAIKESIPLCSKLLLFFEEKHINVIRLGLHASEKLRKNMVAGTYHPAFRELCESEIYFNKVMNLIKNKKDFPGNIIYYIHVNPLEISKVIGQKRVNINKLNDNGFKVKIVPDETIAVKNILVTCK